jgi:hypothetical protein
VGGNEIVGEERSLGGTAIGREVELEIAHRRISRESVWLGLHGEDTAMTQAPERDSACAGKARHRLAKLVEEVGQLKVRLHER